MPKKPRFVHPLRIIRATTGLTQPKFAKLLGIAAPTVQGIELGQRKISSALATRIAYTTGALPGTFEKRGRKPLCLLTKQAYSSQSYATWLTKITKGNKDTGLDAYRVKFAIYLAELVLMAASEKNRFKPCMHSFAEWIDSTLRNFDLEDTVERVHRDGITADSVLKKNFQSDGNHGPDWFAGQYSVENLKKWDFSSVLGTVMLGQR
jgi:transcriptional regulator with XRE-family HTH domain